MLTVRVKAVSDFLGVRDQRVNRQGRSPGNISYAAFKVFPKIRRILNRDIDHFTLYLILRFVACQDTRLAVLATDFNLERPAAEALSLRLPQGVRADKYRRISARLDLLARGEVVR